MKYFKIIFLLLAFSATTIAISSCSNTADKTEEQAKEYASAYICPMHCEGSGSDQAGQCPVCGMDYVENKDHKKDGHNH